ncbi:solute carrier family 15 member 2, partial [Eurytemora carolleeae]|uniref:solute carrier family 15 member 2 n=1 Tax=Eurytemora carolleeae TaxID=1294199 RepID=UPI000C787E4A
MGNQEKAAESLKANLEAAPEQAKKLPYPKSVFFIIGNEFCERFSYYGMKTILSLYLKKKLHFSEDKATVIYHTFSTFCYFTPIYGSILADMYLGKFKTIVSISVFYVLGHLLKTLASIPTLGVP